MPPKKETRGRPPKGDMTIREQKFLKLIVSDGMTATDAYMKLYPEVKDYKYASAKASELRKKLRDRDGYKVILEAAGIGEENLAKKHAELLNAKKTVVSVVDGKIVKTAVPDPTVQMQAVKLGNELHGNMPKTKTEITGANGGPIEATVILVDKDEESDHD